MHLFIFLQLKSNHTANDNEHLFTQKRRIIPKCSQVTDYVYVGGSIYNVAVQHDFQKVVWDPATTWEAGDSMGNLGSIPRAT